MSFYKFYKWGIFATCKSGINKLPEIKIIRYRRKCHKDRIKINLYIFKQWFHFTVYLPKPKERN